MRASKDAVSAAEKILELHDEYIRNLRRTKKIPESAQRLIDEIFLNPVVSISGLSKKWGKPFNSVMRGVLRLVEIGVLREETKKKRNRLFVAHQLMDLLTSTDRKE